MADEAVIIVGKLDDKELRNAIDKLVKDVDNKFGEAASRFEKNIGRMQIALASFATNAKSRVTEIQSAFSAMGTTFQNFATAMQQAAAAASGMGGSGGNGGTGGGGGSGNAQQDTVKWLKEQIALQQKKIDEQKLFTQELQKEVNLLAQQKALLKQQTTPTSVLSYQKELSNMRAAFKMPTDTINEAERKLRRLEGLLSRVRGQRIFNEEQIRRVNREIKKTNDELGKLRAKAAIPTSVQGILGMDANTLEQIQTKMRAIESARMTLPKGSSDISNLNKEYIKLSKAQDEILGKNLKLVESNNALGRAFRYIANRLAFTLSIGAFTNFISQLYSVRGQYELLERSLGVLVNSFEKGTQIFNELNEMAIKSPYTLIELGTAAKQLTAYNFAADEVVDTTKRLADIASALGVPIERLVYNLGQIKAQGVLNARDARDFANAGLAIVPMLSEMYTAEKRFGDQMVTTAQVYDMMKKKMVTYHDVLRVIYSVTDEGGKFFDFQAKQAGTLKVQLANLNLAWNNMLNEIGTEHQEALTTPITMLKTLFKNWREISRVINTAVVALSAYKSISILAFAATKTGVIINEVKAFFELARGIKSASEAMALFNAACSANVIGFVVSALAAAVSYFVLFKNEANDVTDAVLQFGENAAKTLDKIDTLYGILKGTTSTSNTYKKTMGELNEVLKEFGVETLKEGDSLDVVNEKRQQAIELIKLESAERQRADSLKRDQEAYDKGVETLTQELAKKLKNVTTDKSMGIFGVTDEVNQELAQNAEKIAEIIGSVTAENIDLIAGKTGKAYEEGLDKIFNTIQTRMRAIGISEGIISKQWLERTMLGGTGENVIDSFVQKLRNLREAQQRNNEMTEKNYHAAKTATESTMTFTQKVEANARALRNNAKDAVELYNKVMDIVRVAQQNHTITFNLELTAQNPPKWMFDKALPELKKFAENFAAIAQAARGKGGATVNGTWMSEEILNQKALQYASAARTKQYELERQAQEDLNKPKDKNNKTNKATKKTTDELAEALKNEISIIKKLQSEYDKLTKAGVTQGDALEIIQNAYEKTIGGLNKTMKKFNLPQLDLSIIKGKDPNEVLRFFTDLKEALSDKGLSNLARMGAVEGIIEELTVTAKTYNLEKITKGLNNELDKLKEEYELAVDLEANPELGSIFADMMGISREELETLPKDYRQVLSHLQDAINQELGAGKFSLIENLNKGNFEAWVSSQGNILSDGLAEALNKIREYANKVRLDETKKIVSDWDKLLEKYGDYEYKRLRIVKETEEQLKQLRKHGYNEDVEKAINKESEQKLSKLSFDRLQSSSEWILATGDISKLTTGALQILIDKLVEYKRTEKDLKPEQLRKINKVLRDLKKEIRSQNPFAALSISMKEMKENEEMVKQQIEDLEKQIDELNVSQLELPTVDEEKQKMLQEFREELERLKRLLKQLQGRTPEDWLGEVAEYVDKFKMITASIKSIGEEINSDSLQQVAEAADDIIGNIDAAAKGAETWGGWWGAIIGGVSDALPKIMKWMSGNRNIDKQIQESQLAVKGLENAYKQLEYAAEQAYGVEVYGAKRAMIANKQLQLAELENQLRLEKQRKSKYQDKNAILELEGQIIDLKNEINNATNDIVNDLMGISSVGDFAENLVKSMIQAFKEGEDYMKVFEDSFEEMIDNMVMKTVVSRLIGDWINNLFDQISKNTAETERAQQAQAKIAEISKLQAENDAKIADLEQALQGKAAGDIFGDQIREWLNNLYAIREQLNNQMDDAVSAYNAAIAPTPEDVEQIRETVAAGKQGIKEQFDAWMSLFGITFGQNQQGADLSALQQGIQGITEDTAGALESYMNSVSQQVYYQSDILTQIRDILVNFGGDITLATNAQILFELQQSYQVQMSIQSILQGWSNANGLAVRVELAN